VHYLRGIYSWVYRSGVWIPGVRGRLYWTNELKLPSVCCSFTVTATYGPLSHWRKNSDATYDFVKMWRPFINTMIMHSRLQKINLVKKPAVQKMQIVTNSIAIIAHSTLLIDSTNYYTVNFFAVRFVGVYMSGVSVGKLLIDGHKENRGACVSDDSRRLVGGRRDCSALPILHSDLLLPERPSRRVPAARLSHLYGACRVAVWRTRPAAAVHVHAVRVPDDPHHSPLRPHRSHGPAVRVRPGTGLQRQCTLDHLPSTQLDQPIVT